MSRRFLMVCAILAYGSAAASACDVAPPKELKWSPKKVPGWVVYNFLPAAMVDGALLMRTVKHVGLPSGADEQKILTEHASRAMTAMYGGKAGKVKVQKSKPITLNSMGTPVRAKEYTVEITAPGDPIPRFAGVVIRENKAPKTIAVLVTPQDPDAPGDDIDRMNGFAKQFAAHPGFECTAKDMP